jgi:hypothetical protein
MPVVGAHAEPAIGATTQVFTGKGYLQGVNVAVTGTGTTQIYDNTTTTGTPVFNLGASPAVGFIECRIPLGLGLRVVSGASGPQISVVYMGD